MTPEEKLTEMGIVLPEPPAAYQPWVRVGGLVFTSGQLPFRDGEIAFVGKLGAEVSVEAGYQAARLCALNAVAQLKAATGNLAKIQQIVRLEGYVHCAPGFRAHPQVLNGASDLVAEVFGEKGRHTRLALGINEMPLDAVVQLSLIAEVSD